MIETLRRLYRSRALVWVLARRELKARYRGSVLGFLWSLINPLLLLAIYSAVFTLVFVQRAAGLHPYALFLFGGVLAWNFFAASLLDASQTFRNNGPLLRKVIVSPEIFPGVSVLAQSFHLALALPVLFAATAVSVAAFSGRIGWTAVQIVPVLLLLAAAALGGALFVSAVSVHFQDLRDLLQSFLTFWFFATPIIYPYFLFEDPANPGIWQARLLKLNPFTHLAITYQEILFFDGPVGHFPWLLLLGAISIVFFFFGYFVFDRLRDTFAEEV
jgi:ABC-type polysaccharide/polyol phosphate export permease